MRGGVLVLAFLLAAGHAGAGTLVISGQHGVVVRGLRISTTHGDCIDIADSTDITIEQSDIGPCAGNGVAISGGHDVRIYDSYIHPERLSTSCCDRHDGIVAWNTARVTVQGNVVAYGESNVEAPQGVTGLSVIGNFLLNPRGPFPRGQNVQVWGGGAAITVRDNYALSSLDKRYLYPEHQEDSLNFGQATGVTVTGNYMTGGHSPSGCGLIADLGANQVRFLGNTLVDTGQCGIGIASGTTQLVHGNRILNRTPVAGSGNTALYVWNQYAGTPCGPVAITGSVATEIRADRTQSGYWNGGGCGTVTATGNVWDAAAARRLEAADLTPPLIPPLPRSCVARSPYSTQTSVAPCATPTTPTPRHRPGSSRR